MPVSARTYQSIAEAQLLPRLIRLGPNLYGAAFTLMKLLPATYILQRADERAELGPDTVVVETTSGTFGLALAMQTALSRRRLILVSDPAIDIHLHRRLAALGTRVEICPEPAVVGGFQEARLRRLAEIRAELPDSFCPEQYSNPDNPRSYAAVADQLTEALGGVDCVIGPVGSGGSMCGTVRGLRARTPHTRAIGVDSHSSVLFGQPDGPRALRGMGNSLWPANLDHSVFDEVHWCSPGQVYAHTRDLHARHALYQGPTSGAAYQIASWYAERHPDQTCVALLPDEGYRYQATVYDDEWLSAHGHPLTGERRTEPVTVEQPDQAGDRWTRINWARRSYDEVHGTVPRDPRPLAERIAS